MQLLRYRSSHNQDFGSEYQKSLGTKSGAVAYRSSQTLQKEIITVILKKCFKIKQQFKSSHSRDHGSKYLKGQSMTVIPSTVCLHLLIVKREKKIPKLYM